MAAVAGVVCLFAGFSIASESIPPAQPPTTDASPLPMKGPTAWTIPGDGVYIVGFPGGKGGDVQPGLYHAEGNQGCAWRTSKDATFEQGSIIASDHATGDAYVELQAGEFFDTNGCTTWHRTTGPEAPR